MFRGNTLITAFNELAYFTSITSIVNWALAGASNLEKIKFPNSTTSLGGNSLRGTKLHKLELPANLRSIGDYCIYGFNYETLTIYATTPPTISFGANMAPTGNIYVPADSVNIYKSASGWSTYASKIVAIVE